MSIPSEPGPKQVVEKSDAIFTIWRVVDFSPELKLAHTVMRYAPLLHRAKGRKADRCSASSLFSRQNFYSHEKLYNLETVTLEIESWISERESIAISFYSSRSNKFYATLLTRSRKINSSFWIPGFACTPTPRRPGPGMRRALRHSLLPRRRRPGDLQLLQRGYRHLLALTHRALGLPAPRVAWAVVVRAPLRRREQMCLIPVDRMQGGPARAPVD